jgi:signal transduction histidine kinase
MSSKLKFKRCLSRIALIIVLFNGTGCSTDSYPLVSAVTESWLKVKANIDAPADIEAHIEDFKLTLSNFFASPLGSMYQIHRPHEMASLKALAPVLDRLNTAAFNGDNSAVFAAALEIDMALNLLLNVDASLSERSQLHYFQLFFLFSLLIITIILALKLLYSRLEKAEKRELQSLAFSRETIMAQEQERERIAQELHDTVLQDIWRLCFQVDSIARAPDSQERSRLCAEVVGGQKEVMKRIRNLCTSLIPPDLKNLSSDDPSHFIYSLQNLCYDFEQRSGIECQAAVQENLNLQTLGFKAIDSYMQLQCYRIVQECLANIEKHSRATEVSVLVCNKEGNLLVCVSDNGRGFSPPDRHSLQELYLQGNFGLWNMYERACTLNGTLIVDSGAGTGTVISLQLPLLSGGN